ncbi:MAG: sensor histidine kinase, partial [Flavobacteriales bacterium]|nr:sensor histidine kinase [Flavobacteriales bacterium]
INVIDAATSTEDNFLNANVMLYPIPADQHTTLQINATQPIKDLNIRIISMTGKVVYQESFKQVGEEFQYQFDKQHLSDSLGFVRQQELDRISHEVELEKEAKQKKELFLYFSILLVFCIGIVFLLFRERKLKKEVAKANKRYHTLLVESNHRIKNNLQMITSMLEYSGKDIKDKDSLAFKRITGKIHTISALHKHLYLNVHNEKVNIQDYFEEIIMLYQEMTISTKSIKQRFDEAFIESERIIYFGLIFNEMLSNTYEHNSLDTSVSISIVKLKDRYLFSYSDGSKFEPKGANGIGIQLIGQLIDRIEGVNYELDSSTGTYQFEFYV